ncbi:hypothetical protein [Planktothrix sp.]|uniref:hypothetical protein n=1 Tax=Planktothrix sp. TaxID=3088171 RepID=UPI0038D37A6E
MGKFSDIRRAEQLVKDKEAYDTWVKKSTADKQTAYKATQTKTGNYKTALEKEDGYIQPFGIDLAKKVFLIVDLPISGTAQTGKTESAATLITAFRTLVGARAAKAKPTGAGNYLVESRGIKGFVPARAIITQKGSKVEGVISRFTNREYSYTTKNSVSCPFGAITGEEGFEMAANGIKSGTLPNDSSLRFTPQKGILITVTAA